MATAAIPDMAMTQAMVVIQAMAVVMAAVMVAVMVAAIAWAMLPSSVSTNQTVVPLHIKKDGGLKLVVNMIIMVHVLPSRPVHQVRIALLRAQTL